MTMDDIHNYKPVDGEEKFSPTADEQQKAAPVPAPDVPEQCVRPSPEPDAAEPGRGGAEREQAQAPEAPAKKPGSAETDKAVLLEAFGSMDAALRETSRQFDAFVQQQQKLLDGMAAFQAGLPQFANGLPKLQAAINGVLYDKGVEHLCRLHRDIVLRSRKDQDQALASAADELARILKEDFGLETIQPEPGEDYDAEREERVDAAMSPGQIKHCVAAGWMLREQAILRAIVETMYYEMEGGAF